MDKALNEMGGAGDSRIFRFGHKSKRLWVQHVPRATKDQKLADPAERTELGTNLGSAGVIAPSPKATSGLKKWCTKNWVIPVIDWCCRIGHCHIKPWRDERHAR